MRITGLSSLSSKLSLLKAEAPRRADNGLQSGAIQVVKLAKMYAPVDEGNLEDAIAVLKKVSRVGGKAEVTVGVNEAHPVVLKPGVTVGDYAWRMHEGVYNLGDKSLEKEDELNVEVGPKFLTRALRDVRPLLMAKLKNLLKPTNIVGRRKGK